MSQSPLSPPDARQFRNAMGLFATGVAVISAPAGSEPAHEASANTAPTDPAPADPEVVAMTVNAVSAVSLDPMLVLFCPNKKSRFATHIGELSGFTVNILRADQEALSTFFAGGWKESVAPPFRFVPGPCAPRLEGSLTSLHCNRQQTIDAGDHWIVIGRVEHIHVGIPPQRPLLFFGGRYRHVDLSESAPAPDLADVHDEPAHIFYDHW